MKPRRPGTLKEWRRFLSKVSSIQYEPHITYAGNFYDLTRIEVARNKAGKLIPPQDGEAGHDPRLERMAAAVNHAKTQMNSRERLVLCLRYEVDPEWTQEEIAAETCITQQSVSLTERSVLAKIASAYACTVAYTGEGESTPRSPDETVSDTRKTPIRKQRTIHPTHRSHLQK